MKSSFLGTISTGKEAVRDSALQSCLPPACGGWKCRWGRRLPTEVPSAPAPAAVPAEKVVESQLWTDATPAAFWTSSVLFFYIATNPPSSGLRSPGAAVTTRWRGLARPHTSIWADSSKRASAKRETTWRPWLLLVLRDTRPLCPCFPKAQGARQRGAGGGPRGGTRER